MKLIGNWPLAAALVWGGTVVGIGVHGYLKPKLHTLYPIYEIAARGWWAGDPDLYRRQPETGELYRYSPAVAVLFAPLATLPSAAGNALWKVLNGGAFAAAAWVWLRRGVSPPLPPNPRGVALLLALPVAVTSLACGQANLLMVACLLAAVTAAAADRWWLAAVGVAAAVHLKAFPLAFAAVLAVVYWRPFSWRFAAALLAGLALPLAAGRPDYVLAQTLHWFRCLAEGTDINRDRLKSLDRLLEVVGLPLDRPAFLALGAVAGLGVLAATRWYAARAADRREPLTRGLAWFLAWALLFSPSAESVTFAILAPVLGWALVVVCRRPGAWLDRGLVSLSLVLTGPAQTDLIGKSAREFGGAYAAPTVGTLVFAGWLTLELLRDVRAGRGGHPVGTAAGVSAEPHL